MNCPACGYYNPLGAQTCFHCSLALPIAATGDARCVTHSDLAATGACSRCGTFGCGQCLTQSGAAWLCPACVEREGVLPWDERESLGVWRAWWRTSLKLLGSPVQTLSAAEPDGSLSGSTLFAAISSLVGFGPTFLLYAVGLTAVFALTPAAKDADGGPPPLLFGGIFVGYMVMLFFVQVASTFVVAAMDHLTLKLIGAEPRSWATSVRANALAMAPFVIGLLPLCGFYVFPLWALVLRVLALRELHGVRTGQAVLAVVAPMVLFCGLGVAAWLALISLAGPTTY